MFWFVVGLLLLTPNTNSASERPHIVFILADDVGWNDVGFHGSDQIPTPNIDALAYSGIILNQHYVQPICTPTRAALLTSRYPSNIGMQGIPIAGCEPRALPPGKLLPQYLKDLGYTTRIVGKWHLGFYKKEFTPTYRGFDSHLGYWNGLVNYYDHVYQDLIPVKMVKPFPAQGINITQSDIDWAGGDQLSGVDFHRNLLPALDLSGRYATDVFTEEAVNIIETHDLSSPLFLYLAHLACHSGNIGKLLEAPKDAVDKFGHIIEPNRKTFAAMMSKLDESVGKVVAALKSRGILQNTIIVFLSDNGAPTLNVGVWRNWGSNYPLRGVKVTQWEGGVRGVGVLWGAMLKNTSRVSSQLMHVTDWLPTLYTAAGGNLDDLQSAQLDGVDQWSALVDDTPSRREEVLLVLDERHNVSGLRIGHWKYVTGYRAGLDGYSGDIVLGTTDPPYNPEEVLQSDAGLALATVKLRASAADILRLRSQATVTCSSPVSSTPCNPEKGPCLFDLSVDPCEVNDLSAQHPNVVQKLTELLSKYSATLVPQLNEPYDPVRADPAKFNNIWSSWED
ncbi:arylsulfatase B-like isoform X2 [Zootermopsis nevadensis]|uniref:Arylsulfatase B n=1 Tax=Zootermopsis nevadensis TaxID=136037 RepID=A0A067QXZ3_ZOONE|nr:arylsulfatase B-like isoform X2 [Zootermopsis nevadensis]XP_021928040.1 arylsulfatase B-like isoform X2 [Zootermopsis nevadensis]KDR15167.1 Arylsulfatase B [Zootermopsis nevadensis]